MSTNLIVIICTAIGFICLVLGFRYLYKIWRFAGFLSTIRQEFIEHVPFYRLIDILFGKSHAMERHSPLTKLPQHITRANFGLTPEGIQLFPVHSGRWNSYYIMLHAIEYSLESWKNSKTLRKEAYTFKFDKPIGTVVKKNSRDEINTSMAIVVINKKGRVITAYPIIGKVEDVLTVIYLKTKTYQEYNEIYSEMN